MGVFTFFLVRWHFSLSWTIGLCSEDITKIHRWPTCNVQCSITNSQLPRMYYVHVQSSITNLIICVKATRCARNMTPLLCRLNYATVNVGKSSSCFHDVSNALCKEGLGWACCENSQFSYKTRSSKSLWIVHVYVNRRDWKGMTMLHGR